MNTFQKSKSVWSKWLKDREKMMKSPPKPLKKMSASRAVEARTYAKRKAVFLREHPYCFCCGYYTMSPDRELHHVRGRAGKLYLDERFWVMACGGMKGCHTKIHQERHWAIANGFLGGPGEWGVCP